MDRKLLQMAASRLRRILQPALTVVDARRKRVLPQIVRGILVSGTTVITQIARRGRAAGQDFLAARKSIENHLNSEAWDAQEAQMIREMEESVGRQVQEQTCIWIDNTEIVKPYARKMEGLSRVRDADESKRRGETVTEPGYWKLEAQAEIWKQGDPVPLAQSVYGIGNDQVGHEASENHARAQLYDRIVAATGGAGLIVEDRGFDGDVNYQLLEARKLRFLVRQRGDRYIRDPHGQELGSVRVAGKKVFLEGQTTLKFKRRGRKENWQVAFGWRPVRLPTSSQPLWLIAVRNLRAQDEGERWLFFLTNISVEDRPTAERLIRAYVRRWKVEEAIRFVKSDLGLEEVRALKFRALRRLVQLAYWAMLVVAFVLRDMAERTLRKLEELAQIIPKEADFLYYRIRWALAKLLDPLLVIEPR